MACAVWAWVRWLYDGVRLWGAGGWGAWEEKGSRGEEAGCHVDWVDGMWR